MRSFTAIALGLLLAAAALKGTACSAVDPNPPDPHNVPDSDAILAARDGGDGGEASR